MYFTVCALNLVTVESTDPEEGGQRGDEKRGQNRRDAWDLARTGCGLRIHALQMRLVVHEWILSNLPATSNFSSELDVQAQRSNRHRSAVFVICWILYSLDVQGERDKCPDLPQIIRFNDMLRSIIQPAVT